MLVILCLQKHTSLSEAAVQKPLHEHQILRRLEPTASRSQQRFVASDSRSLILQNATRLSQNARSEARSTNAGLQRASPSEEAEVTQSQPASEVALSQKEDQDSEASKDPFSAFAHFMKIPVSQRPAWAFFGFLMLGGTSFAAAYLYQQQQNMLKARRPALGKGGKGLGKQPMMGKAAGKGKPNDEGKSGLRNVLAPVAYVRSDESSSDFGGGSRKAGARQLAPPDMKSQFAVAEFSLPPHGVPPGLGGGKPGIPPGSFSASRASSMAGVESSLSDRPPTMSPMLSEVSTDTSFNGATAWKKAKISNNSVQDLVSMLRSVELIQAAWRRWKSKQRMPELGQKITLSCEVLQGMDMPNVNRLGGCDPFVECRIVRGDPSVRHRGDVDRAPVRASRTEVKRNEMNPRWDEKLSLAGLPYDRDLYVQLVLWDYNLLRNTPIAHAAISLEQALKGSACYSSGKQRGRLHTLGFHPLAGSEQDRLATKVSVRFGFWETHRHRLAMISGSWLPKVKMLGTISSYVEARVVRADPRKAIFQSQPSHECLWSGRTVVVNDKVDPVWDQEFTFTIDAEPSLWLHLILWDTNTPLPDMPIGQAFHLLKQVKVKSGRSHGQMVEHHLQLEDVPDRSITADLSRAKLVIKTGCNFMSADDSEDED